MTLHSLLLSILLAIPISPRDAGAQLEFAGIPWGTPVDQARARLEADGYLYRGTDQFGDVVFGAADSVDLVASFGAEGLFQVELTWLRDPDRLPARFERLARAGRAAAGAPDSEAGEDYREMIWEREGAIVELMYRPRGGGLDAAVVLRHVGPNATAAFGARADASAAAEAERDTTAVGDYHQAYGDFGVLIRADTVKYARLGPQQYRARFLHDWMQQRRAPSGVLYSAALTEVELDCRAVRTRLLRTTLLYEGRSVPPVDVPESEQRWTGPAPGSPDAAAIRSACQALGRQP